MVSKASDDLPLPERPVITVRLSRGISTSTPLRLCSRAPRTEMWVNMGLFVPDLFAHGKAGAGGQRRAIDGFAGAAIKRSEASSAPARSWRLPGRDGSRTG